MKIRNILIDKSSGLLNIEFSAQGLLSKTSQSQFELSFEYLRISAPSSQGKKLKNGQVAVISHKKNVVITNIESVAKHGYRLIFNDGHQDIYSEAYLQTLSVEFEQRWQEYLDSLKVSGHSREAMIDIKQL